MIDHADPIRRPRPFPPALLLVVLAVLGCRSNPNERVAQHLVKGQQFYDVGKYREAEIEFRNVLQINPKLATAHHKLGLTYAGMRDPQQAFAEMSRATAIDPALNEAQLDLGRLLLQYGDLAKAEETARLLVDANPQDRDAQLFLATVQLRAGRTDEAEKSVTKGLEIDANSADGHLLLAQILALRQRPEAALAEIQKAIALSPSSVNYMALGTYQRTGGDLAAAETAFRKAAEVAPTDSSPRFLLVDLLIAAQRQSEAEQLLLSMAEKGPDPVKARRGLAEYYFEHGDLEQAEGQIKQLLVTDKGDPENRYLEARLVLARGDAAEAARRLEQIVKEAPSYVAARYQLALARLRENKPSLAMTELAECVRYQPGYAPAHRALARLHFRAASFDLAIEEANQALNASPHDYELLLLVSDAWLARGDAQQGRQAAERAIAAFPDRPGGYHRLGRAIGNLGQPDEARTQFEKALAMDPSQTVVLSDIVILMTAQKRSAEERIERVRNHLQAHPDDGGAALLLGQYLLRTPDPGPDEGIAILEAAVGKHANLFAAYYVLGTAYAARGKLDQARERLSKLVQQSPGSGAPVHMLLGVVDDLQGRAADAAENYKRALQIDPDFAPAANNLAWFYAEHAGNLDLALEFARKARATLPDEPHIADTLGWILYRRGLYSAAIEHLRDSASKMGDDAQVRYHLGMAYLRNGENEKARVELEAALKLGPFPQEGDARQALAGLS